MSIEQKGRGAAWVAWTLAMFAGIGCQTKAGQLVAAPGEEARGVNPREMQGQALGAGSPDGTIIIEGLGTTDKKALEAIPRWRPAEEVTGVSIDLRTHEGLLQLPPIGRQALSDCVAWASAYYLRSYLWAFETGVAPASADRIFSPTFVYNQINDGRDEGASLVKALDLLKNVGAVTQDVLRYTPEDYRTKPSKNVDLVAAARRIPGYSRIHYPAEIQAALAQGMPVLVHVATDDEFRSGIYPVYNRALRERSARLRNVGDAHAHGRHAMLIVGFDSTECKYLMVNSWGEKWGQQGYTWASCDVVGVIQQDPTGVTFLQEAFVVTGIARARPVSPVTRPRVAPDSRTPEKKLLPESMPELVSIPVQRSGPRESWYWTLEFARAPGADYTLHSEWLDAQPGCSRSPQQYQCHFDGDLGPFEIPVEVRRDGERVGVRPVPLLLQSPPKKDLRRPSAGGG